VGLVARARTQPDAFRAEVSRTVLADLDRAVRAHPDDVAAREALGVALAWQGRMEQALAACDATLELAPRRELVTSDAGVIAQRLGQGSRSLGYWERALAVIPWSSRYRYEVANALAERGEWEKAAAECKQVLERNGAHVGNRLLLMQYHHRAGRKGAARAELEAILALRPPNAEELRRRFEELLR
jgi:tetratricopeptide (TPR) repeat protein